MKKASRFTANLTGLAMFTCFAIAACAQDSGQKIVEDELAQIKKIAAEKYPNLPPDEAVARVATERNNARTAKHSVKNQQILAAVGFSTFYRANTDARAAYCSNVGVDISPFIAAFQKEHETELSLAAGIFRDSGTNFDQEWQALRPSAEAWANNDMQQVASQRATSAAGACKLFVDQPAEVAKLLNYSGTKPDERQILLSYKALQ